MSTLDYHYLGPSAPDSSQITPPLTPNNPGEITSTLGVHRPQSATDVDQFKSIAEQLKAEAQALDQREAQLVEREIAVVKRERAVAAEESKDASTMDRNLREAFLILTAPAIGNYWSTEKIQAMLVDLIKIGDRVTRNAATHNCARQSGVSTASFTAAFPRTNNNQAQAVAASPAPKIATGSWPRLARDASTPYAGINSSLGSSNADMATSPTTGKIPIFLDLSWRAPPATSMTLEASTAPGRVIQPDTVGSPDVGRTAREAGVLGWESDGESVGEGEMEEEGSRSGESRAEDASRSEEGSNSEESTLGKHSSVHAGDGLETEQDRRSRPSTQQHRAPCCACTGHEIDDDDDDRVCSSFASPSSLPSTSRNGTNNHDRPAGPIPAPDASDASTRIPGDVLSAVDVEPDTRAHAYGWTDGGDGMSFLE